MTPAMQSEIRMMPLICDNVSQCFMPVAHVDFKCVLIRVCCTTVPVTVAYGADSHGGFMADVCVCVSEKKFSKNDQTTPNFDEIIIYFVLINSLFKSGG